MSADEKAIFDSYIKKFTEFHQENDAKVKEETGYYDMTTAEKEIFDKMQFKIKKDEDYYDDDFDQSVKKDIQSTKFKAMTPEEQKKYLNSKREKDFANMKEIVSGDNIDLMAKKAMDFFDIPDDKKDLVNNVISKWAGTRK